MQIGLHNVNCSFNRGLQLLAKYDRHCRKCHSKRSISSENIIFFWGEDRPEPLPKPHLLAAFP